MTQNMFQEGLYHVFFKEAPSPRPLTSQGELVNVRIHRWFGTVVNTRLLVTGVRYFHVLVRTIGKLFELIIYCMFLLHVRCVSPPGGADPQCLCLHTNHSHSCMCELQLLCFHVNACVVKPICESTSASTDTHLLQRDSETVQSWVVIVCMVTVCGCWVFGDGGAEES